MCKGKQTVLFIEKFLPTCPMKIILMLSFLSSGSEGGDFDSFFGFAACFGGVVSFTGGTSGTTRKYP